MALAAGQASAEDAPPNYVELRAARSGSGLYRYAEYSRAFRGGAVLDFVYLGLPGQNELYVGAGYQLKATPTLTITPLLYGVAGKENEERGIALGGFALGTIQGWNVYSFLGYFEPLAGSVPRYFFVDSLDVSRKVKRWELGLSGGLFVAGGEWTSLAGPLVVRNDARGGWRAYLRGGSAFEVRLARTWAF